MSIVQVYSETEADMAFIARNARNTIGKALGRAYPTVKWLVGCSDDGTVVQFMAADITTQYGMTLRSDRPAHELETKAVRMAGELLERFKVSREVPDFSHITRDITGEARGAKAGEE